MIKIKKIIFLILIVTLGFNILETSAVTKSNKFNKKSLNQNILQNAQDALQDFLFIKPLGKDKCNACELILSKSFTFSGDTKTYNHFKNLVLKNPKELVSRNEKFIKETFGSENEITQSMETRLKNKINGQWFIKEFQKNPLCLLSECTGGVCSLSRCSNNERQIFDSKVIETIKKNYPNKENILTYVSLGSGSLLSDCVILSKLIDIGYKNINIHLIDFRYEEMLESCGKGKDLLTLASNYQFIQLISWLNNFGSKEQRLNFYAYSTVESFYLVSQEKNIKSDIILGLDYFSEETLFLYPLQDFLYLLTFSLKPNGLAFELLNKYMIEDGKILPANIVKKSNKLNQKDIADFRAMREDFYKTQELDKDFNGAKYCKFIERIISGFISI